MGEEEVSGATPRVGWKWKQFDQMKRLHWKQLQAESCALQLDETEATASFGVELLPSTLNGLLLVLADCLLFGASFETDCSRAQFFFLRFSSPSAGTFKYCCVSYCFVPDKSTTEEKVELLWIIITKDNSSVSLVSA